MTPEEYADKLNAFADQLETDDGEEIGLLLESEALRFIDDNFRNQAWEGSGWKPSKGTILVKSGRLKGGHESTVAPFKVQVVNRVPYATKHNEGLSGTEEVRPHKRMVRKGSKKKGYISALVDVKGHQRAFNYPQRQFAPITGTDSPTLNTNVTKALESWIDRAAQKHGL